MRLQPLQHVHPEKRLQAPNGDFLYWAKCLMDQRNVGTTGIVGRVHFIFLL